jgi:hypothetical protein
MSTRRSLSSAIAARRQLAARASFVAGTGDKDLEGDRAERRLGSALAKQRRASDRHDAAVGRSARRHAAIGLHAADQEVAARESWLKWVNDGGYRGLNAGPFELRAGESGA